MKATELYDENYRQFIKRHNLSVNIFKARMSAFLNSGKKIDDGDLLRIYYDLKPLVPTGAKLLDYLYSMTPNKQELTYTHCLNAALLAGAFADWLPMNEEMRNTLILSGFYYDIGLLQLPYDLLWNKEKLTDAELDMFKEHPVIGYNFVKNLNLNVHVKNAVIMHHEQLNGNGYPYHMEGGRIDEYARYIAIADAYIYTASPPARSIRLTPLQVLGEFEKNLDQYDVTLLMPLMRRIADAQLGTSVQLTDGSAWEVVMVHPDCLSRPVLQNDHSEILDLLKRPGLEISKYL